MTSNATREMFADALDGMTRGGTKSAANAIGIALVRRLGAGRASLFADQIVAAVQVASRNVDHARTPESLYQKVEREAPQITLAATDQDERNYRRARLVAVIAFTGVVFAAVTLWAEPAPFAPAPGYDVCTTGAC